MRFGWGERGWLLLALAFVAVVALWPALRLLQEIALGLLGPQRDTILATLGSQTARVALANTLEVGFWGTLLSIAYGLAFALLVTLTPVRFKGWLVFAFVVQALLPPQVVALAWLQLWLPLRNTLVDLGWTQLMTIRNPLQSREGIIALLGLHYAPLVFLTVRAALINIPAEVIEAARVGGARPRVVVRTILVPLLAPAIVAGGALAFVSCIGNFGIPAFLGIPANYLVLPTLIYRELSGFGPSAMPSALMLSLVVAALAAFGVLVQKWMLRAGHYRVTAARMPEPPFSLRGAQWSVSMVAAIWLGLLLVAPLLALLARSLVPAPGVPLTWQTASFEHFYFVLFEHAPTWRALRNSVGLSVLAAAVLAGVAVLLAYQVEYRRNRWVQRMLPVIELPYVVPGVVLAIAMILLFIHPIFGVSLYNTVWIIFFAYLARFLTIQLRPVISGLAQVPHETLEAAEVSGASFWTRMRRILLPLILPSVTAGAMLVVLLAMNELTVSALLWSSGAETLGVVVFGFEQGGESAAASAVGVFSIALTFAVMGLASWFGRRLPEGVLPWRA